MWLSNTLLLGVAVNSRLHGQSSLINDFIIYLWDEDFSQLSLYPGRSLAVLFIATLRASPGYAGSLIHESRRKQSMLP